MNKPLFIVSPVTRMAQANTYDNDNTRAHVWRTSNGKWYWFTTTNGREGEPVHEGFTDSSESALSAAATALTGSPEYRLA